jgi:hypothetical protein
LPYRSPLPFSTNSSRPMFSAEDARRRPQPGPEGRRAGANVKPVSPAGSPARRRRRGVALGDFSRTLLFAPIADIEANRIASALKIINAGRARQALVGGLTHPGRSMARRRCLLQVPATKNDASRALILSAISCAARSSASRTGCHKPMIIARRGPNLLSRALVDVTYRCETCEIETTRAFMGARSAPRMRVNKSRQQHE